MNHLDRIKLFRCLCAKINRGEFARVDFYNEEECIENIDFFLKHQIEHLLFASFEKFSGASSFYEKTYKKQCESFFHKAGGLVNKFNGVVTQGFPYNSKFLPLLPIGLRGDIDVFVSKDHHSKLFSSLRAIGFKPVGFNSNSVYELDSIQIDEVKKHHWAEKDIAISYVDEVEDPRDSIIEIDEHYLPYIKTTSGCFFLTTVELHRKYISEYDFQLLAADAHYANELGCKVSGKFSTLFFSIVRLCHGIMKGEKKGRLLLEVSSMMALWPFDAYKEKLAFLLYKRCDTSTIYNALLYLQSMNEKFSDVLGVFEELSERDGSSKLTSERGFLNLDMSFS